MQDLSNTIYRYYLDHFKELPFDKQYHFASRLYLWSQDPETQSSLDNLKAEFSANNQPRQVIEQIIELAKQSPVHGSKNAAELRRPYFERYPMLKTYVSVLFRLTFLKTAHNIDATDLMFEYFNKKDLDDLAHALLNDPEATAILSTHAINFLYLYDTFIVGGELNIDPTVFIQIGQAQYDLDNVTHLQLLIYLYTHCVIGESQFYYKRPTQHLDTYHKMMSQLEDLIASRFEHVNLDNKFEFLVCCKIVGYKTNLSDRIFEEAEKSISPDGDYLVDTHNLNPQTDNRSLDKSEHRNVLFIMTQREFTPIG